MKTKLKFFHADTKQPSKCGEVLDIQFSNANLDWDGVIIEKGSSPHFYPDNVYTPYFYFALAIEEDLSWQIKTGNGMSEITTAPGEIWINPPNTAFTHEINEPCYFVILAIEENKLLEHASLPTHSMPLRFLNNYNIVDETLKGIIQLFMLEILNKGSNGKAYIDNLVSLVATHYIQNYSNYHDLLEQRLNSSKMAQADLILIEQYIDEHMDTHISIEDLSDILHMSKFHFLREFKKLVGSSPYQFLISRRLQKACQLLQTTNLSLAEVGLNTGFNDQAHFSRAFKKQYQQTPGQYKQL